jgi:hypothetical protein
MLSAALSSVLPIRVATVTRWLNSPAAESRYDPPRSTRWPELLEKCVAVHSHTLPACHAHGMGTACTRHAHGVHVTASMGTASSMSRHVCRMRMGATSGGRRAEHVVQPRRIGLEGVGWRQACVAVKRRVGLREVSLPQVETPLGVVARRLVTPRVELGRLGPADVRVARGELPLGLGRQPVVRGVPASGARGGCSLSSTRGRGGAAHRLPAHLQKARASFHETCTTGWERRSLMPEPGPSGDRQLAPGTANQWDASLTDELVIALGST